MTEKQQQQAAAKFAEEWAGKGARIEDGKIIKEDGTLFKPEANVNLKSRVGAPVKDPMLERFDNDIAKLRGKIPQEGVLTEAEILEQAVERRT